jgi:hypothetical protein
MQQKKEEPKNIALFLLISQPPNASEIVSVLRTIDKYDGLILCFRTPIEVMPIQHVTELWSLILNKYKGKYILTSCDTDFSTVAELPKEFHDKTILTLSKKVFVHLSTMGINVQLVDRVKGYHDLFLRSAYIQGRALDYIIENYGTKR